MKKNWMDAWQSADFRIKLIGSILAFSVFPWKVPAYFAYVQSRQGLALNDIVLNNIPALDVSLPIFSIMYLSVLYMIIRLLPNAKNFLLFAITYDLETLFRMLSIYFVPLDAPKDLVFLRDPLAEMFIYANNVPVTKDLFFSGHTATMILVCLFLSGKWEKRIAFLLCGILASLLLVQHVHYTIDVIGALFFTPFAYFIAKKIHGSKLMP
ncbi:phosphatase PAP2-related protein [Pseudarcicella hirudinis]|nr:phosphatase PAP2-related protein [Pseudarcicella hirudinis]